MLSNQAAWAFQASGLRPVAGGQPCGPPTPLYTPVRMPTLAPDPNAILKMRALPRSQPHRHPHNLRPRARQPQRALSLGASRLRGARGAAVLVGREVSSLQLAKGTPPQVAAATAHGRTALKLPHCAGGSASWRWGITNGPDGPRAKFGCAMILLEEPAARPDPCRALGARRLGSRQVVGGRRRVAWPAASCRTQGPLLEKFLAPRVGAPLLTSWMVGRSAADDEKRCSAWPWCCPAAWVAPSAMAPSSAAQRVVAKLVFVIKYM